MDRYPCVNRYKHGVDCPGWVNVHGARCEDCVVVRERPIEQAARTDVTSTTDSGGGSIWEENGKQEIERT
ncbi:hypothetical protein CKAH01_12243 [Colletotrichum kahawae]|uniref:Uncharacterized protein n=1 Tax=Colletotrichum kahawae TaxID=34407 RepID=A0AAE0DFH7_COLKA|nr:hypothetical protein CKAH01_12243 [Colletotrichum kahawae]